MGKAKCLQKVAIVLALTLWVVTLPPQTLFAAGSNVEKIVVEYKPANLQAGTDQVPLDKQLKAAAEAHDANGVKAEELQITGSGKWSKEDWEALASLLEKDGAYQTVKTLHISCANLDIIYGDFYASNITDITVDYATGIDESCRTPALLESVLFPEMTEVGENAFEGRTELKNISIPKATKIKASAFYGCTSLEKLTLEAVEEVQSRAFGGCTALAVLEAPVLQTIGDSVFEGSAIIALNLPKVVTVGNSAFKANEKLQSVTLPMVKKIGSRAFWDCKLLNKVFIVAVDEIATRAFGNCELLVNYRMGSVPPANLAEDAFVSTAETAVYTILWSKTAAQSWSGVKLAAHHSPTISFEGEPAAPAPSAGVAKSEATFRVVYDSNNNNKGSSEIGDQTGILYGQQVIVCSAKPTRVGYTFAGWTVSATGKGVRHLAGNSIVVLADTRLYAQWQAQGAASEDSPKGMKAQNEDPAQDVGDNENEAQPAGAKEVKQMKAAAKKESDMHSLKVLLPAVGGGSLSVLLLVIGIGLLRKRYSH